MSTGETVDTRDANIWWGAVGLPASEILLISPPMGNSIGNCPHTFTPEMHQALALAAGGHSQLATALCRYLGRKIRQSQGQKQAYKPSEFAIYLAQRVEGWLSARGQEILPPDTYLQIQKLDLVSRTEQLPIWWTSEQVEPLSVEVTIPEMQLETVNVWAPPRASLSARRAILVASGGSLRYLKSLGVLLGYYAENYPACKLKPTAQDLLTALLEVFDPLA